MNRTASLPCRQDLRHGVVPESLTDGVSLHICHGDFTSTIVGTMFVHFALHPQGAHSFTQFVSVKHRLGPGISLSPRGPLFKKLQAGPTG